MSILQKTILASALRTATATSNEFVTNRKRGARFTLDITAEDGTITLTPKVQAKDHLTGTFVDIPDLIFAATTATGTTQLVIYPGIAETANVSVSDVMPEVFRVVATMSGTTSMTYSISAELYD